MARCIASRERSPARRARSCARVDLWVTLWMVMAGGGVAHAISFTGLGDLPGGLFSSEAFAVSADGSVVVGRSPSSLGHEAFIRDDAHGLRNLRDVLVDDFGLGASLAGWTLTQAMAISADGMTVVGFGTDPSGQTEAWIASLGPSAVPEPSALLFLGSGLAGLAACRRYTRAPADR